MNIKVEAPQEKSKSRKVNAYVKAALIRTALHQAWSQADDVVKLKRAALNGGQIAEADRILNEKVV
jgi:hypothetical protein